MSDFETVYESLLGLLNADAALPWVENAFAPGSLCDREYDRMRHAYQRVCTRLGAAEEDPDLDTMVQALEAIQRELCRRMYETGRHGA